MSSRIDLRAIHTQITCVQAECALWRIRRRMERVMATTTDEAQRLRIAEILREGRCPPARVIRGYHGRFVGCADGSGESGHMPEVRGENGKLRGIHEMGGIKHEIEINHLQGEGRDKFLSKYVNMPQSEQSRMLSAKIGELSLKAEQAARNMSDEDITALKAHQTNLQKAP